MNGWRDIKEKLSKIPNFWCIDLLGGDCIYSYKSVVNHYINVWKQNQTSLLCQLQDDNILARKKHFFDLANYRQ